MGTNLLSATNAWLAQMDAMTILAWGSFDSSTNAVVVYPNDASITSLENDMLLQITPHAISDGTINQSFSAQLQITSSTSTWQSPHHNWGLAPGSPGLPPGLSLMTTGSDGSGCLIYGTPTSTGFYDFTLRITAYDASWNQIAYVDRSFSIKVDPQY
jgi:hypothetical protein